MNRTWNGLREMGLIQAALLHQQNVQAEAGESAQAEPMIVKKSSAQGITTTFKGFDLGRFDEIGKQTPIRGPREGRKPTKAMKKAAKKARRA